MVRWWWVEEDVDCYGSSSRLYIPQKPSRLYSTTYGWPEPELDPIDNGLHAADRPVSSMNPAGDKCR